MSGKLKTFFAITMVILITIVLHFIGWLAPMENFIRRLINPASGVLYSWSVKINDSEENFNSVADLEKAYQDLKSRYLEEQINRAELALVQAENQELREQLNFFTVNNYQYVSSRVIGKNIDPLGSTILIDKGNADGLREEDAVIAGGGVLVGKIAKVEEHSAIVRLINDNQSKIAATVLNTERSIGLVEGGFGISVQMNFIPQNEQINIGDLIVTSGLTQSIPRGLLIGVVEAIERESYQPFQRAILSTSANLEKLTFVSVITTGN